MPTNDSSDLLSKSQNHSTSTRFPSQNGSVRIHGTQQARIRDKSLLEPSGSEEYQTSEGLEMQFTILMSNSSDFEQIPRRLFDANGRIFPGKTTLIYVFGYDDILT